MLSVDGDGASTVAPSGSTRVTFSAASSGTGTTAPGLSHIDETEIEPDSGGDIDEDSGVEEVDVLKFNPPSLAKDCSRYHHLAPGAAVWPMKKYKHLFR